MTPSMPPIERAVQQQERREAIIYALYSLEGEFTIAKLVLQVEGYRRSRPLEAHAADIVRRFVADGKVDKIEGRKAPHGASLYKVAEDK